MSKKYLIMLASFVTMQTAEHKEHFERGVAYMLERSLSKIVGLDITCKHPKIRCSPWPLGDHFPYYIRDKMVSFPWKNEDTCDTDSLNILRAEEYFSHPLKTALTDGEKKERIDCLIDVVFHNEYLEALDKLANNNLRWRRFSSNKTHVLHRPQQGWWTRRTLEEVKTLAHFKKPVLEKLYTLMHLPHKHLPQVSLQEEEYKIQWLYHRVKLYQKAQIICLDQAILAKLPENSLNQIQEYMALFHKDEARVLLEKIITSLEQSSLVKFPYLPSNIVYNLHNTEDYNRRLLFYQTLDNGWNR